MLLLVIYQLIDDPIALGALVISVISLLFTFFALKYQREHNFKSVKPIGLISPGDYEDDIFIRIDNNGIGPLIIKKIEVKRKTETANSLIDIIPEDLNNRIVWATYLKNIEDMAIIGGDSLTLLEFIPNYNDTEIKFETWENLKTELRQVLKDVSLFVEYTDIYEKKRYSVSKSFEFYGRHYE